LEEQKQLKILKRRTTNLSKGSKAVCGAASIGNNVNVRGVLVLIDTNNKHGCIFAWGRDNNLLGTTLLFKRKIKLSETSNLTEENTSNTASKSKVVRVKRVHGCTRS
jgi:hypothetical protein